MKLSQRARNTSQTLFLGMIRQAAALLAVSLGVASSTGQGIVDRTSTPKAKANVVVIVADDLGLQLGCYGDPVVKTPNLDRLAADATRFTRAYCTTASCSASRSVILTGLYNHATGHYGHEHGDGNFSTFTDALTLPVRLKAAGYRTCSLGKYHVAPEAVYHFDQYGAAKNAAGGSAAPAKGVDNFPAIAREFIERDPQRPFFIYYCPHEPHRAAQGFGNDKTATDVQPVKYDPATVNIPAWLPDQPEVRREWAEYLEAISRVDGRIGQMIDVLRATGQYDNTLILVLSDNGPPFPGAKTTVYEPGCNLPLIVRNPRQSARGVITDARVTWADLTPTILEFAGVPVSAETAPNARGKPRTRAPQGVHGRSFLSVLEQPHVEGWDRVFLSHTFHEVTMYYPMRSIIKGRYKYIWNIASPLEYPSASDLYASPTWQAALRRGADSAYGQRTVDRYLHRPRHELYDLSADPGETRNLAADTSFGPTLAELQAELKTWQQATRDPWYSKWQYE